jgi:hypothetical protein
MVLATSEFGHAEGNVHQLLDGGAKKLGICSTAYTAESFEMDSVASEGYHWPAQVKREKAPMGKMLTGLPSLLTYGGDLSGWQRLTERIAVPMAKTHILVIGGSMASGVIGRPVDSGCQMLPPDDFDKCMRLLYDDKEGKQDSDWTACPSAHLFPNSQCKISPLPVSQT